jgi:SAM-dependent methyltransferase
MGGRAPGEITVVDVACSVGLFAIEFAKMGYRSYGVDFDPAAIEIARRLNEEERANAQFLLMDVSDWRLDVPIDIAVCFDVFEHLHDDELGALLYGLKRHLSPDGCMIFHTLPLEYDYLFWDGDRGIIRFPPLLRPFRHWPPERFTRLVRAYAMCRDIRSLCRAGGTPYRESIEMSGHPNPLTPSRLAKIFARAGYEVGFLDTGFLGESQLDPRDRACFHRQPITHRSLRGAAWPRRRTQGG